MEQVSNQTELQQAMNLGDPLIRALPHFIELVHQIEMEGSHVGNTDEDYDLEIC